MHGWVLRVGARPDRGHHSQPAQPVAGGWLLAVGWDWWSAVWVRALIQGVGCRLLHPGLSGVCSACSLEALRLVAPPTANPSTNPGTLVPNPCGSVWSNPMPRTHMAPEILLEGRISKAADVYAFGITLWELFTGGRPFESGCLWGAACCCCAARRRAV